MELEQVLSKVTRQASKTGSASPTVTAMPSHLPVDCCFLGASQDVSILGFVLSLLQTVVTLA